MKFKHIAKVGVELEGIWQLPWRKKSSLASPEQGYPWMATWHDDGSVRNDTRVDPDGWYNAHNNGVGVWRGECVSPPWSPKEVYKWVKHNYPPWCGDSCGMHVHLSFKKLIDYARLMCIEFNDFLLERIKKWQVDNNLSDMQALTERIAGNHHFCPKVINPEEQLWRQDKASQSRYAQLNFAWGRYRTVECRLLPMMDTAEEAVSAIQCLLETTEEWLRKPIPKEFTQPLKDTIKYNLKSEVPSDVIVQCVTDEGGPSEIWTGYLQFARPHGWSLGQYVDTWYGGERYYATITELREWISRQNRTREQIQRAQVAAAERARPLEARIQRLQERMANLTYTVSGSFQPPSGIESVTATRNVENAFEASPEWDPPMPVDDFDDYQEPLDDMEDD